MKFRLTDLAFHTSNFEADLRQFCGETKRRLDDVGVRPNGPIVMGEFLGQWFGFCLIVWFFTACLTGHTVAPGTDYLTVFRVAGTAAFMAYGSANWRTGSGRASRGAW